MDRTVAAEAAGDPIMARKITNYLRVRRKQWGLSQAELAFLLGYRSETVVSRFEQSDREVTLACALTCALVFGCEPRELFPALLDQVEDEAVRRMYELYERLQVAAPTQRTTAKLQLLTKALSRATVKSPSQEI